LTLVRFLVGERGVREGLGIGISARESVFLKVDTEAEDLISVRFRFGSGGGLCDY
jgi:hypothetical protein